MDKGRQFFLAILVFVIIAFVIMFVFHNFWLKTFFIFTDFVALLVVLYEIFRPPPTDRKKKVCQEDLAVELEMDMDGTVRRNMVPITKKAKKKAP